MTDVVERTEVAVVGAGPIGLELAVALQAAGVDYVQFERGQIGQTMTWFPRLMRFFSSPDRIAVAGVPIPRVDESKCSREEYLAYLRAIVVQFDLPVKTYEEVAQVEPQANGGFLLRTRTSASEERAFAANRVVFATGDMHGPRLLGVPGEDLPHVSHYFDEPHRYFRRRLLVVGGKNSAVETALRCHHAGAEVSLAYRDRDFDPASVKYWLLPEIKSLTERGKIHAFPETVVTSIGSRRVSLAPSAGGDSFEIEADFVLLLVGYAADMSLLREAGVELSSDSETPLLDERTMETSVPGAYVVGTAVAGSQQSYRVFIENCHVHVQRVVAALTGVSPPDDAADPRDLPEI